LRQPSEVALCPLIDRNGPCKARFRGGPCRQMTQSGRLKAEPCHTEPGFVSASFLRLCILHETFAASSLELICRNFAVAIDVNHRKIDDVGHGLILRQRVPMRFCE
jgi:hypothetical protein